MYAANNESTLLESDPQALSQSMTVVDLTTTPDEIPEMHILSAHAAPVGIQAVESVLLDQELQAEAISVDDINSDLALVNSVLSEFSANLLSALTANSRALIARIEPIDNRKLIFSVIGSSLSTALITFSPSDGVYITLHHIGRNVIGLFYSYMTFSLIGDALPPYGPCAKVAISTLLSSLTMSFVQNASFADMGKNVIIDCANMCYALFLCALLKKIEQVR